MASAKSSETWELNASTGNFILQISKNSRVVRMGRIPPYLYNGEYWGDYSLNFPVSGGWKKTLQEAKSDIRRLERKRASSLSKHESGDNPRVSAPLKKRIDRVLGRGHGRKS